MKNNFGGNLYQFLEWALYGNNDWTPKPEQVLAGAGASQEAYTLRAMDKDFTDFANSVYSGSNTLGRLADNW